MGVAASSDPTTLLAQIIQGEARTPADQFGVASTIYNRSIGLPDANGTPFSSAFGGGSYDPVAAATANNQFSAYPNALQTPNANSMALAQALQNGSFPELGNTGNALYYNAAGYAYPSLSNNSFSPSSNAYSDLYGQPPSSNFQLPAQGAAKPSVVSNGPLEDLGSPSEASLYDQYSGFGAGQGDMNSGALTYPSLEGGAGGSFAPGNPLGYGNANLAPAVGSGSTAAPVTSGNPLEPSAASGSGASASTAPTATNPNAQAPPVDIVSNAPEIAAANAISWNILSGQVGLYIANSGQNVGGSFYPPMYRTWPQGYMCGGIPTLGVSGFTGFANVYMRINFSAYQPP